MQDLHCFGQSIRAKQVDQAAGFGFLCGSAEEQVVMSPAQA